MPEPDGEPPNPAPVSWRFLAGLQVGTVQSSEINEASGIVASRANPGVLWVHNDSGDSARLFAIATDGRLLGTYRLTGAGATDWEDISIGPGPQTGQDYLYAGDIGDNNAVRASVTVYRVPEPQVSADQSEQTVDLGAVASQAVRYPDGARDAETLMADPQTADLYIVSKREARSRVYELPSQSWSAQTVTLDLLGQLDWGWAVGGDIAPSGDELLLKSYTGVYLYERQAGESLWSALAGGATALPYTLEPQGEAIGFDAAGVGYYTVSEGTNQPLYYAARVSDAG